LIELIREDLINSLQSFIFIAKNFSRTMPESMRSSLVFLRTGKNTGGVAR